MTRAELIMNFNQVNGRFDTIEPKIKEAKFLKSCQIVI